MVTVLFRPPAFKMDDGSSLFLDLLREVEEVSTLGHGKVTQLDFSHYPGDVEGGAEPSLCLPDGLLPQALFGDPLLSLPILDQDAPYSPPPAAPQPETLMPVSLPAGRPPPAPCRASPQPPAPCRASPPRPRSPATTPTSSPEKQTAAPTPPSPPQPQPPPSPVRVVVRTNMVAPVTLGKSSRFMVRIPRPSPPQPSPPSTPRVTRHRVLRGGGKLGPAAVSQPSTVSHPQTPHSTEPPTSTLTTTAATVGKPFRSLVGGVRSGVRQGCSSSIKRKAYELEPQEDPLMERCRQNAINARRNRELKKAQMAELERRAEEADQERRRLAEENRRLREDNTRLQREVGHLTGVLRNQSRLSHILEKVSPVRLTLGDATPLEEEQEEGAGVSRGVCLHLDGDKATLECCSVCAKKAGKRLLQNT